MRTADASTSSGAITTAPDSAGGGSGGLLGGGLGASAPLVAGGCSTVKAARQAEFTARSNYLTATHTADVSHAQAVISVRDAQQAVVTARNALDPATSNPG